MRQFGIPMRELVSSQKGVQIEDMGVVARCKKFAEIRHAPRQAEDLVFVGSWGPKILVLMQPFDELEGQPSVPYRAIT